MRLRRVDVGYVSFALFSDGLFLGSLVIDKIAFTLQPQEAQVIKKGEQMLCSSRGRRRHVSDERRLVVLADPIFRIMDGSHRRGGQRCRRDQTSDCSEWRVIYCLVSVVSL